MVTKAPSTKRDRSARHIMGNGFLLNFPDGRAAGSVSGDRGCASHESAHICPELPDAPWEPGAELPCSFQAAPCRDAEAS